jgi:acetyl-CoA carboxylase carboxyl transferase subunit beta
VAASFATLCDVVLAEPGARLGFAGPGVIEQTIGQRLPAGFQRADSLVARGLVDGIRPRAALRATLGRLLALTTGADAEDPARADGVPDGASDGGAVVRDPDLVADRPAWSVVRQARDLGRPTTLDYIEMFVTGFEELRGDRIGGDCPAVVAGLGRIAGRPVAVVGHQKGHTVGELAGHNYGMASPHGYRKAARIMRLAAKLDLPVVTLVDTPGAYPGAEAEEHGQAHAIAENLRLMAALPVPVVSVITGEGGSGGALALAVADRVLISENAIYSVISPEGCAAILWKDAQAAPAAAEALQLTAGHLLRRGIVDGVVAEPPGGAAADPVTTGRRLGAAITEMLAELAQDRQQLLAERHLRFRRYGAMPGGPMSHHSTTDHARRGGPR